MPNRYKRDLNRLIDHPRRLPGSRSLRFPGALNGVLSSALGLPREPAAPQFFGDLAFMPAQIDVDGFRTEFGLPEIAGDPLGTPDGDNPCWRLAYDSSYTITKYQEPEYGCKDWSGANGLVLTWKGRPSRVLDGFASNFNSNWSKHFVGTRWVYKDGAQVLDISSEVSGRVYGVGATEDTLTVITESQGNRIAIQYPWDGETVTGAGTIAHTVADEYADYRILTDWYFNASGTDAIATFRNRDDRNALHVRRYNISTGFSAMETIWQRGIEGNATKTYAPYGSDTGVEGYKKAAIITSETVIAEHDVPIYVDYVGDSEVTLYLRHKAYSESATVDVNNEEVDSETSGNRNEETRTKNQGVAEFVLSTGEVIGSFGPRIESSYYRDSKDPTFEFASMTLLWTETERYITETNMMADIRYKVVLFEAREEVTDYDFSGQANSEGEISGTGLEETKVVFVLMKNNAELFREEIQETSNTSTVIDYERGEYSSGGYSADDSQNIDVEGEAIPLVWWENQMCNVGYLESSGVTAATLCVHYEDWFSVTGQAEWITKNLLTGYADPDADLFDGRPDMTFYGLGKM